MSDVPGHPPPPPGDPPPPTRRLLAATSATASDRLGALLEDCSRIALAAPDARTLLTGCLGRLAGDVGDAEVFAVLETPAGREVLHRDGIAPEALAARVLEAADGGGATPCFARCLVRDRGSRRVWLASLGRCAHAVPDARALAAVAGIVAGHLERLDLAAALRRAFTRARGRRRRRAAGLAAALEAQHLRIQGANLALIEGERRLLDAERQERVDHLAAGVAHALNNPLGSLVANLEFARSTLQEATGGAPPTPELLAEVAEALADAEQDVWRIRDLARSSFASAARDRRAVVRTDLAQALTDALDHLGNLDGRSGSVHVEVPEGLGVGVARGELARWFFRLLSARGSAAGDPVAVTARRTATSIRASFRFPGAVVSTLPSLLVSLRPEVETAGGQVAEIPTPTGTEVALDLPCDVQGALLGSRRPA